MIAARALSRAAKLLPIHQQGSTEPFFSSSSGLHSSRRRLLLISYYFPPAHAAGALRWQKLAAYAAERGWELDVVTRHPECHPTVDWSRLTELPDGVRAFGVPDQTLLRERFEKIVGGVLRCCRVLAKPAECSDSRNGSLPATDSTPSVINREAIRWRATNPADYVRAYHAFSHFARERSWSRAAAALARKVISSSVHQAVITCGPPHMVHEAGWRVACAAGLPFIMDMRDPWSMVPAVAKSRASPVWFWLASHHERRAVRRAALISANTEPLCAAIKSAYPAAVERVISVMNGYDDETIPPSNYPPYFLVGFAGSIYIDRDPRNFFRAAARFVRENGIAPGSFQIEFIGNVEGYGGKPISQLAREEGLDGYVRAGPPRPRRDAIAFMSQAAMLLSLPQGIDLAIPSKIFEYMQFDAWLLALANPGSGVETLLRDTSADVIAPDDVDGMVRVLQRRYEQYVRGERAERLARHARFSRREQAQVLFDAIDRCIETASSFTCPELCVARPE